MKEISIALILILAFLITGAKAEVKELQPIDYSIPLIKAVVANQRARLRGNNKARWGMITKKSQEFQKNYANFEQLSLSQKGKKRNLAYGNAQLIGMRFITNNRAWISITGAGLPASDGFYLIKEAGEWKIAYIDRYFTQVKKDIASLGKAVKDYYQHNKKIPQKLSDLGIPVPLDLFSDNNMPYVYKVIDGTKCILYSFGPNSKDDKGLIEFKQLPGIPMALIAGDIIWSFSPNNG